MDDDFAIFERWQAGDRAAGDVLLRRHFDRVYCFFRNKIDGDVDDMIQRTFLACVEARDRFRKEASFKTWLLTVARHQLHRHFRDKHRHRNRDVDLGSESVVDLGSSPSSRAARREEERLLLAALRKIAVDLQIALEMTYWEGLTTAELAIVLEVPQGTVKSRLRRAREALAEALAGERGDDAVKQATLDDLEGWAAAIRAALATAAADPSRSG